MLRNTVFCVADVETTGLDPAVDRVVELGLIRFSSIRHPSFWTAWAQLVNPEIPIPPQASAIHHLVDTDVQYQPCLSVLIDQIKHYAEGVTMAAHNALFDRSFLPFLDDRQWICTQRLARHLWPEAPGYSNQILRYWLGLKVDVPPHAVHRAGGDVVVTAQILLREIEAYLEAGHPDDLDALIAFSEAPIYLDRMPFGKHKDQPWEKVPQDYLRWAIGHLKDLDADLRHSITKNLRR